MRLCPATRCAKVPVCFRCYGVTVVGERSLQRHCMLQRRLCGAGVCVRACAQVRLHGVHGWECGAHGRGRAGPNARLSWTLHCRPSCEVGSTIEGLCTVLDRSIASQSEMDLTHATKNGL